MLNLTSALITGEEGGYFSVRISKQTCTVVSIILGASQHARTRRWVHGVIRCKIGKPNLHKVFVCSVMRSIYASV